MDALTSDARSLLEMLRGRVRLLSDGHSAAIELNLDAIRSTMSRIDTHLSLIVDVTHVAEHASTPRIRPAGRPAREDSAARSAPVR